MTVVDDIVTDQHADQGGRCRFCPAVIGERHSAQCLIPQRPVRIRMIVEYTVLAPVVWGAEEINFHRNDSSWCADNAIRELMEAFGPDRGVCMCGSARFEFVQNDVSSNEEGIGDPHADR